MCVCFYNKNFIIKVGKKNDEKWFFHLGPDGTERETKLNNIRENHLDGSD